SCTSAGSRTDVGEHVAMSPTEASAVTGYGKTPANGDFALSRLTRDDHRRRAGRLSGSRGEGCGGSLATLLATPSTLHAPQNAKTPLSRVFASGPAWIRTRDQRIMSPLL